MFGRLVDAGMDPQLAQVLADLLGLCSQPLEHRAAIAINAPLLPSGTNAALEINAYGNSIADSSPTTATDGSRNLTGMPALRPLFNPNGPFAILVNNGPVKFAVPFIQQGPMKLDGELTLGTSGSLPLTPTMIMDAMPIGSIMLWRKSLADLATVTTKWKCMNGSDNSGGSGIDLSDKFIRGGTGSGALSGAGGGANTHNHGAATGSGGTGNTGSNTTGISVASHPDHVHNIATCLDICVTPDAGSGTAIWGYATNDPHYTSVQLKASSTIGDSLTLSHPVSDPGHVHTGPSHTHSISTDDNVPGFVYLYLIEKCT